MASRVVIEPLTGTPLLRPTATPGQGTQRVRQQSIRVPGGLQRLAPLSGQLADLIGVVRRRQGERAAAQAQEFAVRREGETDEEFEGRFRAQFREYLRENPEATLAESPVFLRELAVAQGQRAATDTGARLNDPRVRAPALNVRENGYVSEPEQTPEQVLQEQLGLTRDSKLYRENPLFRQAFESYVPRMRENFLRDMTRQQGQELEAAAIETYGDKAIDILSELAVNTDISAERLAELNTIWNEFITGDGYDGIVPLEADDVAMARAISYADVLTAQHGTAMAAKRYLERLKTLDIRGQSLGDPRNKHGRALTLKLDEVLGRLEDEQANEYAQRERAFRENTRDAQSLALRHARDNNIGRAEAEALWDRGWLTDMMERTFGPEHAEQHARAYVDEIIKLEEGQTVSKSSQDVMTSIVRKWTSGQFDSALAELDETDDLTAQDRTRLHQDITDAMRAERLYSGSQARTDFLTALGETTPRFHGPIGDGLYQETARENTSLRVAELKMMRDSLTLPEDQREDAVNTWWLEQAQALRDKRGAEATERQRREREARDDLAFYDEKGLEVSPLLQDDNFLANLPTSVNLEQVRLENQGRIIFWNGVIDTTVEDLRERVEIFGTAAVQKRVLDLQADARAEGKSEEEINLIQADPDLLQAWIIDQQDEQESGFRMLAHADRINPNIRGDFQGSLRQRKDELEKAYRANINVDDFIRESRMSSAQQRMRNPNITFAQDPQSAAVGLDREVAEENIYFRDRIIDVLDENTTTYNIGRLRNEIGRHARFRADDSRRAYSELLSHNLMVRANEVNAGEIVFSGVNVGSLREPRSLRLGFDEFDLALRTALDWRNFEGETSSSPTRAFEEVWARDPAAVYGIYRQMGGRGASDSDDFNEWRDIQRTGAKRK